MSDDLRDRLAAMSTEELMDLLARRDADEWREEVFPIAEDLLRQRGVAVQPATSDRQDETPEPGPPAVLATFSTAIEANLCSMVLQEAGIEAWLSTEHLAGVSPPLGLAIGVSVVVDGAELDGAREVLRQLNLGEGALPLDPEPCPQCASAETEHVKSPDRLGAVSSWVLFGMPLPAVKWRWACRSCHHEWQ